MKKIFWFSVGLMMSLAMVLIFNIGFLRAAGNLDSAPGILGDVSGQAGYEADVELQTVVGQVINTALTLVGIFFLVLMVYAGYLWMTARGKEDQVEKSKNIITSSIIGLVIVLSAYAITVLVTGRLGGDGCGNKNKSSCDVDPKCRWVGTNTEMASSFSKCVLSSKAQTCESEAGGDLDKYYECLDIQNPLQGG